MLRPGHFPVLLILISICNIVSTGSHQNWGNMELSPDEYTTLHVQLAERHIQQGAIEKAVECMSKISNKTLVADILTRVCEEGQLKVFSNVLEFVKELKLSEQREAKTIAAITLVNVIRRSEVLQEPRFLNSTRDLLKEVQEVCLPQYYNAVEDALRESDILIKTNQENQFQRTFEEFKKSSGASLHNFVTKYPDISEKNPEKVIEVFWNSSSKAEVEMTGDMFLTFADNQPKPTRNLIFSKLYRLMEEDSVMPLSLLLKLGYRDHYEHDGELKILRKLPRNLQMIIKGSPVHLTSYSNGLALEFLPESKELSARISSLNQSKWTFVSADQGASFSIHAEDDSCLWSDGKNSIISRKSTVELSEGNCDEWSLFEGHGGIEHFLIALDYYWEAGKKLFLNIEGTTPMMTEGRVYVWGNPNEFGVSPYWYIYE